MGVADGLVDSQLSVLTTACMESSRCSSFGFTLALALGGFGGMMGDGSATIVGSRTGIERVQTLIDRRAERHIASRTSSIPRALRDLQVAL